MEQGAGLWSGFGTTADSKEESIQDKNGNQWTEGPVEEQNGLETRKVKQRSTSKDRMEFCLREQGVGDERGKVPVSVRQGKEFINGKIQLRVRREENVGDIVEPDEFRNSSLLHKYSRTTIGFGILSNRVWKLNAI